MILPAATGAFGYLYCRLYSCSIPTVFFLGHAISLLLLYSRTPWPGVTRGCRHPRTSGPAGTSSPLSLGPNYSPGCGICITAGIGFLRAGASWGWEVHDASHHGGRAWQGFCIFAFPTASWVLYMGVRLSATATASRYTAHAACT